MIKSTQLHTILVLIKQKENHENLCTLKWGVRVLCVIFLCAYELFKIVTLYLYTHINISLKTDKMASRHSKSSSLSFLLENWTLQHRVHQPPDWVNRLIFITSMLLPLSLTNLTFKPSDLWIFLYFVFSPAHWDLTW